MIRVKGIKLLNLAGGFTAAGVIGWIVCFYWMF